MAQFQGRVTGQSGNGVTRLGSKRSGIRTDANGWDVGVQVWGSYDEGSVGDPDEDDQVSGDCFTVYATGGSKNVGDRRPLVEVREDRITFFDPETGEETDTRYRS